MARFILEFRSVQYYYHTYIILRPCEGPIVVIQPPEAIPRGIIDAQYTISILYEEE